MKQLEKLVEPLLARLPSVGRIQAAVNVATGLTHNPIDASKLVQLLIDGNLSEVTISPDPITGDDRVWLSKKSNIFRISRVQKKWSYEDPVLHHTEVDALNVLQAVQFQVSSRVFAFVEKVANHPTLAEKRLNESDRSLVGQIREYLTEHADGVFTQRYVMSDNRRLYALMNALSHQGGDLSRSLTDFAKKREVTQIDKWIDAIRDEYGVHLGNYKDVIANPHKLWTDPSFFKFKKVKKPFCTLRAALAIEEVVTTGRTGYILQQDQTCSGFQEFGILLRCPVLSTLTNLQGGDKQDLYKTSASIARGMCPLSGLDDFFDRGPGKYFVMRVGYGAAARGLARGMILSDTKSDIEYLDNTGAYVPNILDKLNEEDFNSTFYDLFKPMGWHRAVKGSIEVSKAYHKALMEISPRLRDALRLIKKANQTAIDRGEFLEWTLPSGAVKKLDGWEVNMEAEPIRISMRQMGGKRFQFRYLPMKRGVNNSKAPPCFIHSKDGWRMVNMILWASARGIDIAPIHDSIGTGGDDFLLVKSRWIEVVRAECSTSSNMFWDMMKKYNIEVPHAVFGNGCTPMTIPDDAQYFMG
jgi:hypothetical protein